MQQRRRWLLLCLLADIQPKSVEEIHVGGDLVFRDAFARGTDDKTARRAHAMGLQNAFQAMPFFVTGHFSRNTEMIHARHKHHIAPGRAR